MLKRRTFKYSQPALCKDCMGSGYLETTDDKYLLRICPTCEGSGKVKKTTEGTVTIEPYQ